MQVAVEAAPEAGLLEVLEVQAVVVRVDSSSTQVVLAQRTLAVAAAVLALETELAAVTVVLV